MAGLGRGQGGLAVGDGMHDVDATGLGIGVIVLGGPLPGVLLLVIAPEVVAVATSMVVVIAVAGAVIIRRG